MVASNRINGSESGHSVRIDLRLPSPWGSLRELASALKASNAGYRFDGAELVRDADGWRCEVGESPHDEEIAELFAYEGRVTPKELKAISSHLTKVHLAGPGGSTKKRPRDGGRGDRADASRRSRRDGRQLRGHALADRLVHAGRRRQGPAGCTGSSPPSTAATRRCGRTASTALACATRSSRAHPTRSSRTSSCTTSSATSTSPARQSTTATSPTARPGRSTARRNTRSPASSRTPRCSPPSGRGDSRVWRRANRGRRSRIIRFVDGLRGCLREDCVCRRPLSSRGTPRDLGVATGNDFEIPRSTSG